MMSLLVYAVFAGTGLYAIFQGIWPDLRPKDDRWEQIVKETPQYGIGPFTFGGRPTRVVLGPHTSSRTYYLLGIALMTIGGTGVLHYKGDIEALTDNVFALIFLGCFALIFIAFVFDYMDPRMRDDEVGEVVDIPEEKPYDGPDVI